MNVTGIVDIGPETSTGQTGGKKQTTNQNLQEVALIINKLNHY